jgi:arylsulfatase
MRYNDWKAVFMEQRAHRFDVWRDPFVVLRAPKLFNLRRDPFERADTDSNMYNRWWCEHAFVFIPAQAMSLQFANTFREFPPRQGAAKFNVEATMDILKELTPAND